MRKKRFEGYVYDEPIGWENINAFGFTPACVVHLMKRKKDMGKFKYRKVRIIIEEMKENNK